MRLFIAIELDECIKTTLGNMQKEIKTICPEGRFPDPKLFHLTLSFLGEVQANRLPELLAIMEKVAQGRQSFTLTLQEIGYFPKGNKAIVWAGVKNEPALYYLRLVLVRALETSGFQTESGPFAPHITLAREISLLRWEETMKRPYFSIRPSEMAVKGISLMVSHRLQGELRYDQIKHECFCPSSN